MAQSRPRSLSNEGSGSGVGVDLVLKLDRESRRALVVGCLVRFGTTSSSVGSGSSAIAGMGRLGWVGFEGVWYVE